MAGPQDIQRYPQALVDLLGLKATGDAPHLLSNAVALTLEGLDFYLLQRRTTQQAQSTAMGAAGGSYVFPATFGPASNEYWFVTDASVWINGPLAAGISCKFSVAYTPGASSVWQTFGEQVVCPALEQSITTFHFERPLILPPNTRFIAFCNAATGALAAPAWLNLYYSVLTG